MLKRTLKSYTSTSSLTKHINCVNITSVIVIIIAASSHADTLEQALSGSEAELNTLAALSQTLYSEYTKVNITLDNVRRSLYSKCEKLGVSEATVDAITAGASELRECTSGLVNGTELFEEIEAARPIGDLETVFHKYCARRFLLTDCISQFNIKLLPCLNSEEQAQDYILMRIFYTLLEFACQRNGEPIILFIAEHGPECLESQKQHIINCFNASFQDYLPAKDQDYHLNELPEFVLQSKQCLEIYDLERCVLTHLEQCNEATPGNMVEAVFRYIRKETKCQREVDRLTEQFLLASENLTRSSSFTVHSASFALLLSCYALLMVIMERT